MHMTGADLAVVLGGATVRGEAAFFIDRHYLRSSPSLLEELRSDRNALGEIVSDLLDDKRAPVPLGDLFVPRDTLEWGLGIDYLIEGFFPLLQINQIVGLDSAPRLLVADPETRLTALLRRSFFGDRLEAEVRTVYAIERGSWFAFPRLSYAISDAFRIRLGYLAVGGPRESLIGQFSANDEVVLQARYRF
jgi:hypothetical protein